MIDIPVEFTRRLFPPRCRELLQQKDASTKNWRSVHRKLRDKLLEDERFQLALEISQTCNLENYTVSAAWGMAMLKVRCPEPHLYSSLPRCAYTSWIPILATLISRVLSLHVAGWGLGDGKGQTGVLSEATL